MADPMVVDEMEKKGLKRKREKLKLEGMTSEERDSLRKTLNDELESLFRYFDEVLNTDLGLGLGLGSSVNAMTASLLEEKSAPYSKLVSEIYEKLKERDSGVTIASVKSSLLFVGQRVAYGVPKPDVDVLEDETRSSLWCWETRDMKFLPNSLRGELKVRRTCRKKINERITAILDVISTLQNPEGNPTCVHDMMKSMEKLSKVLAEADIRKLMESLTQKSNSQMSDKEAKRKGASLIKELEKSKREAEKEKKELEKSKREAEKEKKKMDRELQKEKLQSEKEKKRLQLEAEKDEKRREKEELESKKAEREQRRREKEEAERKKQLTTQKQASIMERFLKRSKTNTTTQNDTSQSLTTTDSVAIRNESTTESVSLLMDSALQQDYEFDVEEIRKSHMNSWRCLGHSIRSNNKLYWGLRRKPKTQLIKELKLTNNKESACDDDLCMDSLVDGWEQTNNDDKSCHIKTTASVPVTHKCLPRKQLLQFDKSNRPAFYGIWPKKSSFVRPRHPLKKDPDLDYDIDSDEEWEEEEPGESLSDSEKEEEETLDEGSLKADDDEECDDGFFVPDGYLSENEGVETDRVQNNVGEEVTNTSPSRKSESESDEYSGWIRQQKYLRRLTEHALKKNQPLIIVNMMHEKAQLLSSQDLTGSLKVEQTCLQTLTILAFPGGVSIEVPSNDNLLEENEASTPSSRVCVVSISDTELREIVSVIQSCGQGINKVVEALQQTLPDIPKSHLRNKVREISDFVDNRWKVKNEILHKLGMSTSPDKTVVKSKSIAKFFTKRCLPPSRHVVNPCESSPEPLKPSSSNKLHHKQQKESTGNV